LTWERSKQSGSVAASAEQVRIALAMIDAIDTQIAPLDKELRA
jgi:hypothetical protein